MPPPPDSPAALNDFDRRLYGDQVYYQAVRRDGPPPRDREDREVKAHHSEHHDPTGDRKHVAGAGDKEPPHTNQQNHPPRHDKPEKKSGSGR